MATKLILITLILAAMVVMSTQFPYKQENRRLKAYEREFLRAYVQDFIRSRRSCVALGGTGCANNNGKCCRKGNPYTGEMRKCVNTGSFSEPVYTCVEA